MKSSPLLVQFYSEQRYLTPNMSMSRLLVLLLFFVVDSASAGKDSSSKKSEHRMALAWSLNPIFGLIGTFLNSFILYMFYTERQTFIKPINAMIW